MKQLKKMNSKKFKSNFVNCQHTVLHFLNFRPVDWEYGEPFPYEEGLKIARKLGGKKYHNKSLY